jgi:Flp pilus assembly protein TadD
VLAGAGLIVLVAAVIYFPSLRGGFLIDDDMLLTESPLIKAQDGLYRFWCTTEPYDYWPVTNTTLWIEWRLWGPRATGYRVTNLVLHVVDSLLIWTALRRLSIPGAFLASLLFAVHPVNVDSVAWIAQRKNLLAMLFGVLAILAYLKSEAPTASVVNCTSPYTTRWYWLAFVGFVMAILSKISAVILPALLLGIVAWQRPVTRRDLARMAPFCVFALVLVGVNLRFRMQTLEIPAPTVGLPERLLGGADVVWFYLSKALLPIQLVFVYPRWHIELQRLPAWLPLLAAVVVTAVLWRHRQGSGRAVLFAWGYFCVALVPVMGFTEQLVVADHYQHVALIGVVTLAAAAWATRTPRTQAAKWALNVAAVAAVGTLGFLTWRHSGLYVDNVTLFQAVVERYPDSAVAQHYLGYALLKARRPQEAREHLVQAVRIQPAFPEAHNTLGGALAQAGQFPEAIWHFQEALRLRPDYPGAHNNLGTVLRATGRREEAIEQLHQALRFRPNFPEAHCNLGKALLEAGRRSDAIGHFQEAVRLNPNFSEARNLLVATLGDAEQAREPRP